MVYGIIISIDEILFFWFLSDRKCIIVEYSFPRFHQIFLDFISTFSLFFLFFLFALLFSFHFLFAIINLAKCMYLIWFTMFVDSSCLPTYTDLLNFKCAVCCVQFLQHQTVFRIEAGVFKLRWPFIACSTWLNFIFKLANVSRSVCVSISVKIEFIYKNIHRHKTVCWTHTYIHIIAYNLLQNMRINETN